MPQLLPALNRSDLLMELSRMKKLGFFIVDEAFNVAAAMDMSECSGLSITEVAFIASERGYAQYKSKLHSDIEN